MKIVYITPQLPFPPVSGGRIKTLSTIKSLIKIGAEITMFSFIENINDKKYVKKLKKIGVKKILIVYNHEIGERNRYKQLTRLLQSLLTTKPFGVLRYYNQNFAQKLNKYIKENAIDIFWINSTSMVQYSPKTSLVIKILENYDVESRLYEEGFKKGIFLHLRFLYFLEWIKYSIYEKIVYKKFDIVFSVSNRDKKLLQEKTGQKNIFSLPPSIELKDNKHTEKIRNRLVFVGTLFWYPNKDSIAWFLRSTWPLLKKQVPSLKLWIIGKYSPNYKPSKIDGVEFLGFVKNIDRYMKKAQIFIAPIRYGTGIRMKILEAMSHGIPVVSTYEGAMGLKIRDGKELLLARDKNEFVEKVILLLKNKQLRLKLVRNGRKFIEKNYSSAKLHTIITAYLNKKLTNKH